MNKESTSLTFIDKPKLNEAEQLPEDASVDSRIDLRRAAQVSEERTALELSKQLRVPLVKLASLTIDPQALKCLSEATAREHKALPIKVEDTDGARTSSRRVLVVAMENPGDLQAITNLEFSSGCKITPLVATSSEIGDAIERYYTPEHLLEDLLRNISESEQIKILEVPTDDSAGNDLKDAPAVRLVNLVLLHALKKGASDVHLEPTMYDLKVRVRVAGLLEDFAAFPKWFLDQITSRIKILAQMNIAEHRRPQDGHIKVLLDDRDIDVRVSTLPTCFGEKTVLRILGANQKLPATSDLGLRTRDLKILKRAAAQPQGMIVVTGPTGNGKTTTLYSILNEKKSPTINIVTIEDPIEIQLPGLNQVQVNVATGMTFAACMRSLLRQDPDVVLLGEIRDSETQQTAMQAAQTGHLILTTLHANSSTAAVSRLLDLGGEPRVVAEVIQLLIAQRLLRKICKKCVEMYEPPKELVQHLGLTRHNRSFVRGKGCEACGHTGYDSRFAIYEVLPMTSKIRELIAKRASEVKIRRAAVAAGMSTLLEQGVEQIRNGVTTCEEVARVIQIDIEEHDSDISACPHCAKPVDASFLRCPYCTQELKRTCLSCRQDLDMTWTLCPYCGTANLRVANQEIKEQKIAAGIGFVAVGEGRRHVVPRNEARKNKILVVDDLELNRRIATKALQGLPFTPEVIEAKDGAEALTKVKAEKPDLIVLDLMMPGMSGFDVCRKIREDVQTAFIPIIMLTASTTEEHRVEGFLTGTDDYMTKPFSVADLHARVTRLFRRTYGM